ncbi:MAG: radical SAM protein [Candidatus Thorarchaeota archaeon]|nr:MAG: radical SAM protein [Candidatus Thorarchaeota archaeon]
MFSAPARMLKAFLDGLHPDLSRTFLPWIIKHPRYLKAAIPLAHSFREATKRRDQLRSEKLRIPPVLILSVTSSCNLRCVGCYAAATGTVSQESQREPHKENHQLDLDKWRSVLNEARQLGVFGFIIAGGEPFLYQGILELCMEFKDRFFLIVTNGTTMNESHFKLLRRVSNVAMIISLEGDASATDSRRGPGVYKRIMSSFKRLWAIGVLTGFSATVTRENFEYWADTESLHRLWKKGLRIGVFIEYIPSNNGNDGTRQSLSPCSDEGLMLNQEERARFRYHVIQYRENNPMVVIHSPNDEKYYGGCVSAGQGFAHVTPSGDVTACPVSNLATHSLRNSSLREALASPLFIEIRKNGHLLEDHDLPCALLSHEDEVMALARSVGAYRTDTREPV